MEQSPNKCSKDGLDSQQHIEIPIAVPVLVTLHSSMDRVDDGVDWTQQTRSNQVAMATTSSIAVQPGIRIEDADVIPTYEMVSYGSEISSSDKADRRYMEEEQLRIAMENANARTNEEFWQDQAARSTLKQINQENEEVLKAANMQAALRDKGGNYSQETKVPKTNSKEQLNVKDTAKSISTHEKKSIVQSGGGYQVREYDTKEYDVREYQSNYEYKSIYD